MQKKVVNARNKKAPKKGASNVKESIFNYDAEVSTGKKKLSAKQKRNLKKRKNTKNDFLYEDKFIGAKETPKPSKKKIKNKDKKIEKPFEEENFIDTKEVPKISKKKLEKIKKKKKKENIKRAKEIRKRELQEEKQRIKNRKKLNPKNIAKRRKRIKIAEIIFVILLIILGIVLFLLSPIFNITKIETTGNEKISSSEIISLSGIEKGINIFKVNNRQAIENIKQNTYIESVIINKKMAGTIQIEVKERDVDYLLDYNGSYAYIDKKGFIIDINQEKVEGKIKIIGYNSENIEKGNILKEEDIKKLAVISNILSVAENYEIKQLITSINIENDEDYILYLESENKTVHLGDTSNLDIKILYLQSILEKEKDKTGILHLDVDFRNKYPYASWN